MILRFTKHQCTRGDISDNVSYIREVVVSNRRLRPSHSVKSSLGPLLGRLELPYKEYILRYTHIIFHFRNLLQLSWFQFHLLNAPNDIIQDFVSNDATWKRMCSIRLQLLQNFMT